MCEGRFAEVTGPGLLIPTISYQLLYQHIQATLPVTSTDTFYTRISGTPETTTYTTETVSVLNQLSLALIARSFSILTTV
jgi:hypothetical protein